MYRRRRSPDDVASCHPNHEIEDNDDDENEEDQNHHYYQQQHQQHQAGQPGLHQVHGQHRQQPQPQQQRDTQVFVHSEAYAEQLTEPLLQPSTSQRGPTHRSVNSSPAAASASGSHSSSSSSNKLRGRKAAAVARGDDAGIATFDDKHVILDDKSVAVQ